MHDCLMFTLVQKTIDELNHCGYTVSNQVRANHGRTHEVTAIDTQNFHGYIYPIVWRINKAGHVDPLRYSVGILLPIVSLTAKLFLQDLGLRMEAIISYRRTDLRISLYFPTASQPANLLQPVRQFDRGPPTK